MPLLWWQQVRYVLTCTQHGMRQAWAKRRPFCTQIVRMSVISPYLTHASMDKWNLPLEKTKRREGLGMFLNEKPYFVHGFVGVIWRYCTTSLPYHLYSSWLLLTFKQAFQRLLIRWWNWKDICTLNTFRIFPDRFSWSICKTWKSSQN